MRNPFKTDIPANRVFGLDLLRALAILFVVVGHGQQLTPFPLSSVSFYFLPDGVGIFFVLSGFLIGHILLRMLQKERPANKDLYQFWKRRWMRTLPNYYLVLILLCAIHFLFDPRFSFASNWRYFFFLQNLVTGQSTGFFAESWSLSVEEWFYLTTPAVLFLLCWYAPYQKKKVLLFYCFTVIVALTLFRYYRFSTLTVDSKDGWDFYFNKPVLARFDSIIFGLLGAYTSFYHSDLWRKRRFTCLAVGISLFVLIKVLSVYFVPADSLYNAVFATNVTSLATLLLLPFLSNFRLQSGIFYHTVTRISLISYSMYLLHLSLIREWIIRQINWNVSGYSFGWIVPYSVYWLLTILLSVLLYKHFELPILRWRDKRNP